MDFDYILHWIFIFVSIGVVSYAIGTLLMGIHNEIEHRKIENERRNNKNHE
jgi:hypothetical protein